VAGMVVAYESAALRHVLMGKGRQIVKVVI
jgi:hypothetical protein